MNKNYPEFDWHGESWSIRPVYENQPNAGEYFIQKYNSKSPIPMNLACLTLYLGIHKPSAAIPLETLALFFELTAKMSADPLQEILENANQLRLPKH